MANIKSIGGNPIVLDASGIAAGAVTPDKLADMGGITAGAALGITGNGPTDSAAWLQRVSTSDGPTTIRSVHGNTVVQDGELVPVNMVGIETTGFNQWDGTYSSTGHYINANGQFSTDADFDITDYIPVVSGQTYYVKGLTGSSPGLCWYDANKEYMGGLRNFDLRSNTPPSTFTVPSDAAYVRSTVPKANAGTFCINISDPTRNGTYVPYWQQTRSIPAGTLRGAGTVYDELTETERITRVGVVDLGTLTWTATATGSTGQYRMVSSGLRTLIARPASAAVFGDMKCSKYETLTSGQVYQLYTGISVASDGDLVVYDPSYATADSADAFKTAMSGVMLHYAIATPTVTPIDPPLNMSYRTEQGGTERVMVPTGELSAPPTLVTAQGYTAESLRDAALSAIAPVENGKASTNYAVGSYLIHSGQLCRVTTAIATGEAITIGTNVTTTTVMAEVIALTQ